MSQDTTTTLQGQLNEKKALWAERANAAVKEKYTAGIDAVINSGIYEQAINVGDIAPDFTLSNATGKETQLSNLLKEGPVVLTWYRGGWCPYCNITLRFLQNRLADFKALGAKLVALTPELPDKSLSNSEKNELEFEVLSDIDNAVAKDYGIVFKLIPEVAALYKKAFDLAEYNGNDTYELPLAATYVINTDGKVAYAFLDAEYRNRAEPADIIAALEAI